jgi:uncharacterized protein YeaO (DUF488 family)
MIKLKHVQKDLSPEDGNRILVKRFWPRGMSKERAAMALWLKDVAPSTELRQWFGHDLARWQEYQKRSTAELRANKEAIRPLKSPERTIGMS